MKRLLIVGSGLTGCSLSYFLSRATRPDLLEVAVWDKGRGIGGRMSTTRSNKVPNCSVDLGAQYFSFTPEYQELHKDVLDLLLEHQVLAPLTDTVKNQREYPAGTRHCIAPDGAGAMSRFFLNQSGVSVSFRHQVSRIDLNKDAKRWAVTAQDGTKTEADALVLTLPVPQALALKGNFNDFINSEVRKKLDEVTYSSRYALGLFYNAGTKLPGDWTSVYVDNNACIRFVSKDNEKRKRSDQAPSVLVHTSVPFGLQHLEAAPSVVQPKIIEEMRKYFPDLPEPEEIRLHKWRYSQVYKSYEDRPGCIVLHSDPPLILAGDAFSHSNCNGVFTSSKTTLNKLMTLIPGVAV